MMSRILKFMLNQIRLQWSTEKERRQKELSRQNKTHVSHFFKDFLFVKLEKIVNIYNFKKVSAELF